MNLWQGGGQSLRTRIADTAGDLLDFRNATKYAYSMYIVNLKNHLTMYTCGQLCIYGGYKVMMMMVITLGLVQ